MVKHAQLAIETVSFKLFKSVQATRKQNGSTSTEKNSNQNTGWI